VQERAHHLGDIGVGEGRCLGAAAREGASYRVRRRSKRPPYAGVERVERDPRALGPTRSDSPGADVWEELLHRLDDAAGVDERFLSLLDGDFRGVETRVLGVVAASPQRAERADDPAGVRTQLCLDRLLSGAVAVLAGRSEALLGEDRAERLARCVVENRERAGRVGGQIPPSSMRFCTSASPRGHRPSPTVASDQVNDGAGQHRLFEGVVVLGPRASGDAADVDLAAQDRLSFGDCIGQ
jgi:hypothetical protein